MQLNSQVAPYCHKGKSHKCTCAVWQERHGYCRHWPQRAHQDSCECWGLLSLCACCTAGSMLSRLYVWLGLLTLILLFCMSVYLLRRITMLSVQISATVCMDLCNYMHKFKSQFVWADFIVTPAKPSPQSMPNCVTHVQGHTMLCCDHFIKIGQANDTIALQVPLMWATGKKTQFTLIGLGDIVLPGGDFCMLFSYSVW